MRSIRTSLLVGAVVVTACAFALASIAIYRGAKSTLIADVDEELGEELRLVASTVRAQGATVQLGFEDLDMPEYTTARGDGFLQLWLEDGTVLYRSPTLAGGMLTDLPVIQTDQTSFAWARTPDGRRVRAVSIRFEARHEANATGRPLFVQAVAACEPEEIDVFLDRLKILLLAVGALTGLAAALTLAVVIRSSLRPLDVLAGQIEGLRDDVSSRVHMGRVPREMEPIVQQLNQLLARLESAFQRERTFSADIAHELRTPIADLRSTVEVMLSRPRSTDDYRDTLESTLDPIRRVQAIVERLLYLGRLDAGQIEIEEQPVDLCELVTASWQPVAGTVQRRRLSVEWDLPSAAHVVSDPLLLALAIRNVLENATNYANEGGYVRISIGATNGANTLRIVNSGSNVAPEEVGMLLRRFARGDVSRTAKGEHFGLGLALAAKIVSALHGAMDVQSRLGGEFSVTFSFESARERAVI